ncbi:MAG: ABC transporter permease, partial [Desulfobacterales bacterium]|nr:ABC transporter permease [Desulfobacterales bacterium]
MKIFFLIGWRNLWRNKRRSLVVISSIALGIFAMMFSMALMNGLNNQMVENTIRTSLGHIAVQRAGFQDDMKLQNSLDLSETVLHSLERTPGIEAYAPRIQLEGMIRSSEASRGVLIIGIDPETEQSVSGIAEYLLPDQGGTFLLNRGDRELLISKTLAEKLDLRVGDKAVILFQDIDREISGAALPVRGLYQSPIDSFDKYVIYTGMDTLAKMAGIGNKISRIVVRTENRDA